MPPSHKVEEKDVIEVSIEHNESATDTCTLCARILNEKSETHPSRRDNFDHHVWRSGEFLGAAKKSRTGKCRGCAILVRGILQNQWFDSAALGYGFHIRFLSASSPRLFTVAICEGEYDPKTGYSIHAYLEFYVSGNPTWLWPAMTTTANHLYPKSYTSYGGDMAGQWLRDCHKHHTKCRSDKPAPTRLPLRVLDISRTDPDTNLPDPFLFITDESVRGRYAALSYCWGATNQIKTTRETIHEFQDRIPWTKLPQTYGDCILLCRDMRIPYLWIDALCIIQGDLDDWVDQSAKMATIYGNSHVTIAATSTDDCDGGMKRISNHFHKRVDIRVLPDFTTVHVRFRRHASNKLDIGDESGFKPSESSGEVDWGYVPLLRRGWTFQENILSPRYLQFGPTEMIFECRHSQRCECRSRALKGGDNARAELHELLSNLPVDTDKLAVRWHEMIEDYSRRALTQRLDLFPALSGVAKSIMGATGSKYYAGLWEHSILSDLTWQTSEWACTFREPANLAPTWSWASSHNAIKYDSKGQREKHELDAHIVEITTTLSTNDPLGRVSSGTLTIEAWSFEADLEYTSNYVYNSAVNENCRGAFSYPGLEREEFELDINCSCYSAPEDDVQEGTRITCVLVAGADPFIIVLIPSPDVPNAFRRIAGFNFVRIGEEIRNWKDDVIEFIPKGATKNTFKIV